MSQHVATEYHLLSMAFSHSRQFDATWIATWNALWQVLRNAVGGTMRTSAVFLLFSVMATGAVAEEDPCKSVGEIGEKIMTARQNRVSLQSTLSDVKAMMEPKFHDALENIIITAYEIPAYNSEELKKNAIGDFRDQVQLGCMKGRKSP